MNETNNDNLIITRSSGPANFDLTSEFKPAGDQPTAIAELIEGMLARFKVELNPDSPDDVTVVATGGFSGLMAQHTESFNHVNPDLTLIGLRMVHEMNNA